MRALNVLKYIDGGLWRSILRNKIVRLMSTVDPNEIEHYSALKTMWWDEKGPMRCLHSYNPLRIQFLKDGLINVGLKIQNPDFPLEDVKIVDVGCGGGILTEGLATVGARITGIDVSADLIDLAKEHIKLDPLISKRVNYIQTTVEDFVQKERETYDVVVTSEVLEHVSDPQLFLKECVKLVKPGKSIFITTINKTLTSWLSTIIANEYIFKCAPLGTHQWNKFIAPHEVQRILKDYGCKTKLICGIKLNPFTDQWSFSSSTSTFYALHAIKEKKIGI